MTTPTHPDHVDRAVSLNEVLRILDSVCDTVQRDKGISYALGVVSGMRQTIAALPTLAPPPADRCESDCEHHWESDPRTPAQFCAWCGAHRINPDGNDAAQAKGRGFDDPAWAVGREATYWRNRALRAESGAQPGTAGPVPSPDGVEGDDAATTGRLAQAQPPAANCPMCRGEGTNCPLCQRPEAIRDLLTRYRDAHAEPPTASLLLSGSCERGSHPRCNVAWCQCQCHNQQVAALHEPTAASPPPVFECPRGRWECWNEKHREYHSDCHNTECGAQCHLLTWGGGCITRPPPVDLRDEATCGKCRRCGAVAVGRKDDREDLCAACWDGGSRAPAAGLLPCPFCGGHGDLLSIDRILIRGRDPREEEAHHYFVRCGSCACEGGWGKSEAGARRCWNLRGDRTHLSAADRERAFKDADWLELIAPDSFRGPDYRTDATAAIERSLRSLARFLRSLAAGGQGGSDGEA